MGHLLLIKTIVFFFKYFSHADKYDEGGPNFWFPMSTPHQDPSRWLFPEFLSSEGRNPLGQGQVNTAKNAITSFQK